MKSLSTLVYSIIVFTVFIACENKSSKNTTDKDSTVVPQEKTGDQKVVTDTSLRDTLNRAPLDTGR